VQKLFIPWIIPKEEFVKYGISKNDIIQYKAIDAGIIVKNKSIIKPVNTSKQRKTIVIRLEESAAAYVLGKTSISNNIISEFSKEAEKYNVLVLARYKPEIDAFRKQFGRKVKITSNVVDGKSLLSVTDLFIGSGGTMTAEAALMGIPTISYDAVPNHVEKYLVKIDLVRRETNPKNILRVAKKMLEKNLTNKEKAEKVLDSMEDPFLKLMSVIKTL
jgi:predicted glycosyltransferase